MPYANNKGAVRLISDFIIYCQDSIYIYISKPENPRLLLASIAESLSLSLTWWHIQLQNQIFVFITRLLFVLIFFRFNFSGLRHHITE